MISRCSVSSAKPVVILSIPDRYSTERTRYPGERRPRSGLNRVATRSPESALWGTWRRSSAAAYTRPMSPAERAGGHALVVEPLAGPLIAGACLRAGEVEADMEPRLARGPPVLRLGHWRGVDGGTLRLTNPVSYALEAHDSFSHFFALGCFFHASHSMSAQ